MYKGGDACTANAPRAVLRARVSRRPLDRVVALVRSEHDQNVGCLQRERAEPHCQEEPRHGFTIPRDAKGGGPGLALLSALTGEDARSSFFESQATRPFARRRANA